MGLGSPVFDKLEAELAKAVMSLPVTKGFEIGSGFTGSIMTGSAHNDDFYIDDKGNARTRTNRSGGIQDGISNGETIVTRIAFKPTSTITSKQRTVTRDKQETELRARCRHDPCIVPRGGSYGGSHGSASSCGPSTAALCPMSTVSRGSSFTRSCPEQSRTYSDGRRCSIQRTLKLIYPELSQL